MIQYIQEEEEMNKESYTDHPYMSGIGLQFDVPSRAARSPFWG
jgi:hypothetical protein